ncbi:histone deacetylase 6-like protein [Tanacetum coccineum]
MVDEKKHQVTFFYEPRIGDYDYGQTHAMKTAIIIQYPKNAKKFKKFHVPSDDCPFFEGVYEFSQFSAGGSIGAALTLNDGTKDIVINLLEIEVCVMIMDISVVSC